MGIFIRGNIANKCILADRASEDKRQQFLNEPAIPWMISHRHAYIICQSLQPLHTKTKNKEPLTPPQRKHLKLLL